MSHKARSRTMRVIGLMLTLTMVVPAALAG